MRPYAVSDRFDLEARSKRAQHLACVGKLSKTTYQTFKLDTNYEFVQFLARKYEYPKLDKYGAPCQKGRKLLDAQYKGFLKYDRKYPDLKEHAGLFDHCLGDIERVIGKTRYLSIQEVVNRLNWDTSVGYPFNRWYKNKREFFETHDINLLMAWYYRDLDNSSGPPALVTSFMKDELRPKEKLDDNSLRQINGFNILYLIALNRYTLDYNDRFISRWKQMSSAVGFNPMSMDWDYLVRRKLRFKNHTCDDTSRWDSSMPPFAWARMCPHRCQLLLNSGLNPDLLKLFERLYLYIPFSYVLMPDGYIYVCAGGNKSGSPTTTEDNTCYNIFSAVAVFESLGIPKSEFDANSDDINFGDDKWLSHNFDFTFDQLASKYKELFGMEKTNEMDGEGIEGCTFCSRRPVKKGEFWFSKMVDGSKALHSVAYANELLDPRTKFQRVCGLRIAYFMNDVEFDILTDYGQYLLDTYSDNSWKDIRAGFLTRREIFYLYLKEE